MSKQNIILLVVVTLVVVFMYVILPKLKLGLNQGKIFRAAIFCGILVWLGFDFYMKEKYWYLLILALGAFGFFSMLISSKQK